MKVEWKNLFHCSISVYRSLILDKYLPRAYVPLLSNSHKYSIKQFKMSFGIGKGSKGIRQWPVNQCTSSMMIHKITHSVDFNKWLKRLSTQLNKPIKILLKSPRLLSQRIKKRNFKTLGTSVKKQSNFFSLPRYGL